MYSGESIKAFALRPNLTDNSVVLGDNEITFLNLAEETIYLNTGIFATTNSATSTDFEFAFFKNGAIINTTFTSQVALSSKGQTTPVSALITVIDTDIINLRVRNVQDTRDVTVEFLNLITFKVG